VSRKSRTARNDRIIPEVPSRNEYIAGEVDLGKPLAWSLASRQSLLNGRFRHDSRDRNKVSRYPVIANQVPLKAKAKIKGLGPNKFSSTLTISDK